LGKKMKHRPSAAMALGVILSTVLFAILWAAWSFHHRSPAQLTGGEWQLIPLAVTVFQRAVELGAAFYGFSFLFTAVLYLLGRDQSPDGAPLPGRPAVGILYLCCDDLDREALESLAGLQYDGELHLIVHDDSHSAAARAEVDAVVSDLRARSACHVRLLRRSSRNGGKPAAINYVLAETGHLYEFFILCDNDSVALDPQAIPKALSYFREPGVAVVQCRNVAAEDGAIPAANRLLARSIDASHVFLHIQARFGWSLFIGHNAFLRTSAVLACGGFTPGVFADDLDLAVRLNFKKHRIVYAPHIRFGEKHPPSYEAFRRRAYKWAYGCMQVLRSHAWRVLASRELSFPEKLSFFAFAGFYVGQTLLLAYLFVHFLLAPLVLPHAGVNTIANLGVGIALAATIYAPTVSYFLKERNLGRSLGSVLLCGLVYGTTDFVCARAVRDCLAGRKRAWIPTNAASGNRSDPGLIREALFGLLFLLMPLFFAPELLYQPCAYLFLGKFLFGPGIALLYRDRENGVNAPVAGLSGRRAATSTVSFLAIAVAAALLVFPAPAEAAPSVSVRGKDLFVNGAPFLVKGMHYGPWRPGTGPGKGYPYPPAAEVDSDLSLIAGLHANTVLVFDPPEYVLDLADHHGLKVLYAFHIQWWTFGSPEGAALRQSILERVRKESAHPAILGWVLGNEVPVALLVQRGQPAVEAGLADLYRSVKAIDPVHPVTHSNWPVTKNLQLNFFDIAGFNVYPVWPPEVVAMGFGAYLRNVLQPIAGSKPLLLTEFGANSLEAGEPGQARLVKQCWEELKQAGACGGVVFEFADEWWKNYDNPRVAGAYWDRETASNDEKTHDQDPEEYYGIADAGRRPKPAYATVREMFAGESRWAGIGEREIPGAIMTTLVLLAAGTWVWARARQRE
jgi:cellulose synthase/poly-beta-1,6-N-acetylglucosamine synthase-like glycosyltransferase